MEVKELPLKGAKLFFPQEHCDERGSFVELFRASSFSKMDFVQDNCSISKKGVLRGMHFQLSPPQAKLVTVLSGKIYDVVVDLREASPTFGKWEAVTLSGKTQAQLFVPAHFAHGFCVLSDEACVVYKMSAYYDPAQESSFSYDDPDVGIEWPLSEPILSPRDQNAPKFCEVVSC